MPEISKLDIYKEQYAHFRSMNDILYKIPPIFTAVIGGLWYFAVTNIGTDKWIAAGVFLFAAVSSVCFINVLHRFRLAFTGYLDNLNEMDGDMRVTIKSRLPSTLDTIQFLLFVAAALSIAGVFHTLCR